MDSKCQPALDFSHHLSRLSLNRFASPLKGFQKRFGKSGILHLAGGLPSPDYFPFASLSAEVPPPDLFPIEKAKVTSGFSYIWSLITGGKPETRNSLISVPKYPAEPNGLSLSSALQYGSAIGQPQLQRVIREFTEGVFRPAYSNYTTLVHTGNTAGWLIAVTSLCDPGQGVLMEEWTYPSAIGAMMPYGIKPVKVAIDCDGMRSDSLRELLVGWDETARGMPRPHVMYTIPVGQNPTGSTMPASRKRKIYDICVEFGKASSNIHRNLVHRFPDIIIVEDDPYYFLQEGSYIPPTDSGRSPTHKLDALVPSYVRYDYQGRVIRLDSFSKTIAPGSRLGWFTCNPLFAERFERQAESGEQAPCGFGQALVTSLLLSWGHDGYMRWLEGLRRQYTDRRNFMLDCFFREFDITAVPDLQIAGYQNGSQGYLASRKLKTTAEGGRHSCAWFSFVPLTSGMFVWIHMDFKHHSAFGTISVKDLEMKLWVTLAEAGVLLAPGAIFSADRDSSVTSQVTSGHFRISFSNSEFEDMEKAIKILANVFQEFFSEPLSVDTRLACSSG